jgi:hypothetical protein
MNTLERNQPPPESSDLSGALNTPDLTACQIQQLIAEARQQRDLRLVQLLTRFTRSCAHVLRMFDIETGDKPATAPSNHMRPSPGCSDIETPALPPVQTF